MFEKGAVQKARQSNFAMLWAGIRKQGRTNMGSELHFHKM